MYTLSLFSDAYDVISSLLSFLGKFLFSSIQFINSVFIILPDISFDIVASLPTPLNYLFTGFIGCLVFIIIMKLISLIISSIKVW